MATLTFVDTNVLIAAHRGESPSKELAQALLKDSARAFVVSTFLYLEVIPKAVYHKNAAEVEFLRTYFDNARIWISDLYEMVRIAQEEAERRGLGTVDALHVAAAHMAGAKVLVTLENKSASIYRASLVQVARLA